MRPLRIAINSYGLTLPLIDGRVKVDGFDLEFVAIDATFGGMRGLVRSLDFDIAEMPFASYFCCRSFAKGLTAIPVFVTRNFHHGAIYHNLDSGISAPKDLEGRTVGVNRGYTVTTALWARGILQADYGVDLRTITWAISDEEHVAEYQAPANVDRSHLGESIADLLASGSLPAAVGDFRVDSPKVKPLIPDARAAGARFFQRTGIYPINHGIVIKTALLEEQPKLAEALYAAFSASKQVYAAALKSGEATSAADRVAIEMEAIVGDPFPFGVEANRTALDAMLDFAFDQQVISTRWRLEELFAPSTLRLG